MISDEDRQILEALAEDGGRDTKHVAMRVDKARYEINPRSFSAALRYRLLLLERRGFVGYLDPLKPVAWVRTKEGTKALSGQ